MNNLERREIHLQRRAHALKKLEDSERLGDKSDEQVLEGTTSTPNSLDWYEGIFGDATEEHHSIGIRGTTVHLENLLRESASTPALKVFSI